MNINTWENIKKEIYLRIDAEPSLKNYLESLILSKNNLMEATSAILASKLNNDALSSGDLSKILLDSYHQQDFIQDQLIDDILFFLLFMSRVAIL